VTPKQIDATVLAAIGTESAGITLREICAATHIEEHKVDRSLQRMRKRGDVRYLGAKSGWVTHGGDPGEE